MKYNNLPLVIALLLGSKAIDGSSPGMANAVKVDAQSRFITDSLKELGSKAPELGVMQGKIADAMELKPAVIKAVEDADRILKVPVSEPVKVPEPTVPKVEACPVPAPEPVVVKPVEISCPCTPAPSCGCAAPVPVVAPVEVPSTCTSCGGSPGAVAGEVVAPGQPQSSLPKLASDLLDSMNARTASPAASASATANSAVEALPSHTQMSSSAAHETVGADHIPSVASTHRPDVIDEINSNPGLESVQAKALKALETPSAGHTDLSKAAGAALEGLDTQGSSGQNQDLAKVAADALKALDTGAEHQGHDHASQPAAPSEQSSDLSKVATNPLQGETQHESLDAVARDALNKMDTANAVAQGGVSQGASTNDLSTIAAEGLKRLDGPVSTYSAQPAASSASQSSTGSLQEMAKTALNAMEQQEQQQIQGGTLTPSLAEQSKQKLKVKSAQSGTVQDLARQALKGLETREQANTLSGLAKAALKTIDAGIAANEKKDKFEIKGMVQKTVKDRVKRDLEYESDKEALKDQTENRVENIDREAANLIGKLEIQKHTQKKDDKVDKIMQDKTVEDAFNSARAALVNEQAMGKKTGIIDVKKEGLTVEDVAPSEDLLKLKV